MLKKMLENNLQSEIVSTNFLKVLVDDKEATLAELNKICGPNYDVFYHIMVPKKRKAMYVLVDTTPTIEREATGVGGDGGDI